MKKFLVNLLLSPLDGSKLKRSHLNRALAEKLQESFNSTKVELNKEFSKVPLSTVVSERLVFWMYSYRHGGVSAGLTFSFFT